MVRETKSLTDEDYDRLWKEGAKQYANHNFLQAWYFYFDEINKSNKKSLDSLINSVFCLMKAGSVRQYYFSERKKKIIWINFLQMLLLDLSKF